LSEVQPERNGYCNALPYRRRNDYIGV